ncbi:unnamed protein product [marine sediment metagenome]|uniref:Uncharacterized protein n=1 Tax=marine sediment metagenome TaxID=412755 RepID=X0Z5C9_9ZZZZ
MLQTIENKETLSNLPLSANIQLLRGQAKRESALPVGLVRTGIAKESAKPYFSRSNILKKDNYAKSFIKAY